MEKISLSNKELLGVQKPSQYLGGELHSVIKNPHSVTARIALCFPDTYEVGMSHVGIQILYDIINRIPYAWAERAYMPFPDMEETLRRTNTPLYALESKSPLAAFDVIGFSLQYELCGTNILGMLDLAHIPFYASERTEHHPLIIGGGPYSYHPESLAPFFDLFFLGDAEEFMPELVEAIDRNKEQNGTLHKSKLIASLGEIEGIYIPSEFTPQYRLNSEEKLQLTAISPNKKDKTEVKRRLLPTLVGAPFPKKPVVPNTEIVHNRLSLEVMRGCVRGCRFCQAGYLYRPQRERSPEEVLDIIKTVLPQTGYEEISLLSLSTADYCSIVPLLRTLMDTYGQGETLAISFPSTRVDALTPEVLEQVQRVRRTNFTIAPEGGSQRLRDVINKGVSDEQILETCNNVFSMGWSGIKMYFMIGLPTETDDDLYSIIDLAKRIKEMPSGKNKDITISVSTHVPKPHTPFQWAEQIPIEETIRKHRILSSGLKKVGVKFRYHDPFSTFLEGVFCRAGRELAPTIVRAYELGARLDAWQDHLDQEIWETAFIDTDVDPHYYLRERDPEEILPWDHLSCDIPKSYFLKEYKKALKTKTTPDCLKTSCSTCGACNYDTRKNILWPRAEMEKKLSISIEETNTISSSHYVASFQPTVQKLRVCYSKTGAVGYLGHLELSTLLHRSIRRSQIPVCYSAGFHPLPKISFGPPLSLGLVSRSEFFDIQLYEQISIDRFVSAVNQTLPEGIFIQYAKEIPLQSKSLQQEIKKISFHVKFTQAPNDFYHIYSSSPDSVLHLEIKRKAKRSKNKKHSFDRVFVLKNHIEDLELLHSELRFSIKLEDNTPSPTPIEIAKSICGLEIDSLEIEKTATIFYS